MKTLCEIKGNGGSETLHWFIGKLDWVERPLEFQRVTEWVDRGNAWFTILEGPNGFFTIVRRGKSQWAPSMVGMFPTLEAAKRWIGLSPVPPLEEDPEEKFRPHLMREHEATDDFLAERSTPCEQGQKMRVRIGHWPPYTEWSWCVQGLEFVGGVERILRKIPSWEHGDGESWCVLKLEERTKYDIYLDPDPFVVVKWVWGEDYVTIAAIFSNQWAAEGFASLRAKYSRKRGENKA